MKLRKHMISRVLPDSIAEALGLRRLAAQAGYRYERGEDTDA